MRISDTATFLKLPPGTLFSKYRPCAFGDLCIKEGTIRDMIDFRYLSIVDSIDVSDSGEFVDVLTRAQETGESIPMTFDEDSRDGMFDKDQLYAVWDREDVLGLIAALNSALERGYGR